MATIGYGHRYGRVRSNGCVCLVRTVSGPCAWHMVEGAEEPKRDQVPCVVPRCQRRPLRGHARCWVHVVAA